MVSIYVNYTIKVGISVKESRMINLGHKRADGLTKIGFDEQKARFLAHRIKGRAYKCPECDQWHITSQPLFKKREV